MAQNPSNIHIGAARIFLNVTAPASGAPPTPLAHVDGVPGTAPIATNFNGIEVGYTQDATTFTYKQNKQEVVAEQSLNPVDVFVLNEEIQIEFTAMEHVFNTLKAAFDNVGTDNPAGGPRMMFYGGDGGQLVSVTTMCVALSSRIRTAPTKHEVLVIYRVYNMEGIQIPYNRTGEAVYKITMKGLTDTTRVAGDRLFQWFRENSIIATTATAGTPGFFGPTGADLPANLATLTGMAPPVVASPNTAWTVGQYVLLGDGLHAKWSGTAYVDIPATTATSGTPGTYTPAGASPPLSVASMSGVTASPATAWTTGQYVLLRDNSSKAYWNGTAWIAGTA